MAPAGNAQPLLMQLAGPMTTRADDVAPDIDLLGLVERFVPGLGARTAQPELLLLADPRVPDAALLERELTGRGVPYLRLGAADFGDAARISWRFDGRGSGAGRIAARGRDVDLSGLRAIWHTFGSFGPAATTGTAPEAEGGAVTEQWAAALLGFWRTFGGRWVNPPEAVMLATDKLGQLREAAAAGWPVPDTLVTNDPDQARAFVGSRPGGVVAKAVRRLTFERDGTRYLAWTRRLRDEDTALLDAVRAAPCMLQEYVPKRIEVRVTVVGERIFAAELHSQDVAEARDDFRRAIARIPILPHDLPADVAVRSHAVVAALGLVSAAIDIAVTPEGEYVFLEVNAPGSWAFVEERTGLPISAAVADLLVGQPSS